MDTQQALWLLLPQAEGVQATSLATSCGHSQNLGPQSRAEWSRVQLEVFRCAGINFGMCGKALTLSLLRCVKPTHCVGTTVAKGARNQA